MKWEKLVLLALLTSTECTTVTSAAPPYPARTQRYQRSEERNASTPKTLQNEIKPLREVQLFETQNGAQFVSHDAVARFLIRNPKAVLLRSFETNGTPVSVRSEDMVEFIKENPHAAPLCFFELEVGDPLPVRVADVPDFLHMYPGVSVSTSLMAKQWKPTQPPQRVRTESARKHSGKIAATLILGVVIALASLGLGAVNFLISRFKRPN